MYQDLKQKKLNSISSAIIFYFDLSFYQGGPNVDLIYQAFFDDN